MKMVIFYDEHMMNRVYYLKIMTLRITSKRENTVELPFEMLGKNFYQIVFGKTSKKIFSLVQEAWL